MVFSFRVRGRGRSFAFRGRPFRGRGRGRGQFASSGDERHRVRNDRRETEGHDIQIDEGRYRDYESRPKPVDHGTPKSSGRRERDLRDQLEEYNRPFRGHSNSPPRKRPHHAADSEISKRQSEEMQQKMHSRQSPSPLRITVGNEIFFEERITRNRDSPFSDRRSSEDSRERLAPLYERLGPPVDKDSRDEENKDYRRRHDSQDGYRNRANSRERSRYDTTDSSKGLSDRYNDRKHSSTWDRGDRISQSSSSQKYEVKGDRSSKDRYGDRDFMRHDSRDSHSGSLDRKTNRDKDWKDDYKMDYKMDRQNIEKDKEHHRLNEKLIDRGRNRERHGRHSQSPSPERKDLDRHLLNEFTVQKINYFHGKTVPSETDGQYVNSPSFHANMGQPETPDTPTSEHSPSNKFRPLKSILKKSGNIDAPPSQRQDQLDLVNQFIAQESRYRQTLQDQGYPGLGVQTDIAISRPDPLTQVTHPLLNVNQNVSEKPERKQVLPGLVAYDMDVDDEENFLYGKSDDVHKQSSRPLFPIENKRQSSEHRKSVEKGITAETNLPFWAAAAPADSALSAKLFALHEKIHGPKPITNENELRMRRSSEGDHDKLLKEMADEKNEPKKEEDIDLTVQNILKSIGFDFELSKRMQELAKQKKEKETKKPGEQHIGIINQTASFLGGGMSSDVTENLFEKKVVENSKIQRSRESIAQEFQNKESNANESQIDRHSLQPSQKQQEYDDSESGSESSSSDFSSTDSENDKNRSPSNRQRSQRKSNRSQGHDRHGKHADHSKSPNYGRSSDDKRSPYVEESWKTAQPTAVEWPNQTVSHEWQQEYPHQPVTQQPVTPQPYYDVHSIPPEYPHYYGHVANPGVMPPYGPPPGYPPFSDTSIPPPGMFPPQCYPMYPGSAPGMYNCPPPFFPPHSEPQKQYHSRYDSKPYSSNLTPVPLEEKKKQDLEKKKSSVKSKPVEKKSSKLKKETKVVKTSKSDAKVETKKKVGDGESTRIVLALKSEQKRKERSGSRPSSAEPQKKHVKVDREKEKPKITQSQQRLSPRDRERLAKECEERKKKLDGLEREMSKLRKQQNEIMRKRRRQRDGHKDPLLAQNSKLQDEIAEQIKILRKAADESSNVLKGIKEPSKSSTETKKEHVSSKQSDGSQLTKEMPKLHKKEKKVNYQYFDPGHHWCRLCNHVALGIFEYLAHLQSKKHQQKFDPFERPWLESTLDDLNKKPPEGPSQACAIKGVEFMMSTAAFYCSLCKEFSGDVTCANAHLKSDEHNDSYRCYVEKNPFYEKRMVLERTAYLSEKKEEDAKQKKQAIVAAIVSEPVKVEKEPDIKKELIQESEPKDSKDGFGKFAHKDEQKRVITLENKPKEDKKVDDKKKEEKSKEIKEETQDSSKIAIKLTGKTGIKPPPKKVLPPWTPVTRKIPTKKPREEMKKPVKVQDEDPPSLDKFLTIVTGSAAENLPVVIETNVEAIPLPPSAPVPRDAPPSDKQVLADAVKEQLNTEKMSKENSDELKYLCIETPDEITLKPKPPPPPSQNMSLPGDNMATSSAKTMYDIFYHNDAPGADDVKKEHLAVKENLSEGLHVTDVSGGGKNGSASEVGNANKEAILLQDASSSATVDNIPVADNIQSDLTSVTVCSKEELPTEDVPMDLCSDDQTITEIVLPNKIISEHPNSTDTEKSDPESRSASTRDSVSEDKSNPIMEDSVVDIHENLNENNSNIVLNTLAQESSLISVFETSAVSSTTISETSAGAAVSSVAERSVVQSSTDPQTSQCGRVDSEMLIPLVMEEGSVVETKADDGVMPSLYTSITSQLDASQSVAYEDRCHLAFNESGADTTSSDKVHAISNSPGVPWPMEAEHSELKTDFVADLDDKINADTTSNARQFIGDTCITDMSLEGEMVLKSDDEDNKHFESGNDSKESKADTTSNVTLVFISAPEDNLTTSEVDVQVPTDKLGSSIAVDAEIGRNAVSTSNVCNEMNVEHVMSVCSSVGEADVMAANSVVLDNMVGTSSRSISVTVNVSNETDSTEAVGISLERSVEAQDASVIIGVQDSSMFPNTCPVDNDEPTLVEAQSDNGSNLIPAELRSIFVAEDEAVAPDVQSSTQTYFEDPFICSQTDSNKDLDVELSSASTCTSSTNNWTDVVCDAFAAIATLAESTSEVSIFSPSTSDNFGFVNASEDSALAQSSSEILISDPAMSETFINSEAIQIEGDPLFGQPEVVDSTTHSSRDYSTFGKNEIVGTSSEIFGSNLVVVDSTEVDSDESVEDQMAQNEETGPSVDACDSMSQSSEDDLVNMGSDFEIVDECQSD